MPTDLPSRDQRAGHAIGAGVLAILLPAVLAAGPGLLGKNLKVPTRLDLD